MTISAPRLFAVEELRGGQWVRLATRRSAPEALSILIDLENILERQGAALTSYRMKVLRPFNLQAIDPFEDGQETVALAAIVVKAAIQGRNQRCRRLRRQARAGARDE